MSAVGRGQEADTPRRGERLAGLQADYVVAALEGVGRARHRFGAQPEPPPRGAQRVPRVDLDVGIVLVQPQCDLLAVGTGQPDPGAALVVAREPSEREVDLLLSNHSPRAEIEVATVHRLGARG